MNIIAAIQNTISISQFNRGLAGKIFQDVKNSGAKVVMKNNAPECVLLSPDEWLEQFNTFSIYEILPQLIDLWGLNVETQVKSKKNIARLTDR